MAIAAEHDRERLRRRREVAGATPGALEAFMAVCGVRTMALRVERAQANAGELVCRLEAHPGVTIVRYPGLLDHPQHDIAGRQMRRFGSVNFFELQDADTADVVCTPWASSSRPPASAASSRVWKDGPRPPVSSTCRQAVSASAWAASSRGSLGRPVCRRRPRHRSKELSMFIQPWDAALAPQEWQEWLAGVEHFGVLAVNNVDPLQAPIMVPTHFTVAGNELLIHFARPNPVWPHLEAASHVRLAVVGDYAYIPSYWRALAQAPETDGVPTSYYAAVQFDCTPTIIDHAEGKVDVLTAQLDDLQPEGRHGQVATDTGPYSRMLAGIRAVRLAVTHVDAKFKFDDHKPREHRQRVAALLDDRHHGLDQRTAVQQRRRLDSAGEWSDRTR